jgi:hypothetical protein
MSLKRFGGAVSFLSVLPSFLLHQLVATLTATEIRHAPLLQRESTTSHLRKSDESCGIDAMAPTRKNNTERKYIYIYKYI